MLARLLLLCLLSAAPAFADGMILPQAYAQKIETPDQQALIHFANNVEHLVIETSLVGTGTNFAWILPLPAPPKIEPVSEYFFSSLELAFKSKLIQHVHPYYAGILLIGGLIFLGFRSIADEKSMQADLPLCICLGALVWIAGGHFLFGLFTLGLALYTRAFTRSAKNFAIVLLAGFVFSVCFVILPTSGPITLVDTLGVSIGADDQQKDVTILSVQRAGLFESVTLQSSKPGALLEWLKENGYHTPHSAESAIRYYVENGWVFVATKVHRDTPADEHTTLHPLAFTFATKSPIYPARLTATDNGNCLMNLYVFGDKRAAAKNFQTLRCERAAKLKIRDPQILVLIGGAAIGTKISARLTPAQMSAADININWTAYGRKGALVFSPEGARLLALNITAPLAVLAWFLASSIHDGWRIDQTKIWRRRIISLAVCGAVGFLIYAFLPKVEVVPIPRGFIQHEYT
jgi:hypothetical protein